MYNIGIDVGSTYTKYCIMLDGKIISLFAEKSPIRQKEHFENTIKGLLERYPDAKISSCGYGRNNVDGIKKINELTALAKGVFFQTGLNGLALDIGGQDTKIIVQEKGILKCFFLNDKCAAGSGLFLTNILEMIGMPFEKITLKQEFVKGLLTTSCAVFAQSEVIDLIANNKTEEEIIQAVLFQILTKAKALLSKVDCDNIMLSGGLSKISGIREFASSVLGKKVVITEDGAYLAAIGCAISTMNN